MRKSIPTLTLNDMKSLLVGARTLGGPLGTTVELCILSLHRTMEVLDIQLESINWREGWAAVTGKNSRPVRLALSVDALTAIRNVAGSAGGRGQAVTAGRGVPMSYRDVRLDRLQKKLLPLCPTPISVEWNMHSIRHSGASILQKDGIDIRKINAALGFPRNPQLGKSFTQMDPVREAHAALGRWAQLLGGRAS